MGDLMHVAEEWTAAPDHVKKKHFVVTEFT